MEYGTCTSYTPLKITFGSVVMSLHIISHACFVRIFWPLLTYIVQIRDWSVTYTLLTSIHYRPVVSDITPSSPPYTRGQWSVWLAVSPRLARGRISVMAGAGGDQSRPLSHPESGWHHISHHSHPQGEQRTWRDIQTVHSHIYPT